MGHFEFYLYMNWEKKPGKSFVKGNSMSIRGQHFMHPEAGVGGVPQLLNRLELLFVSNFS